MASSISVPARRSSSIWPLAIYWVIGALVGCLLLRAELMAGASELNLSHLLSIAATLLATAVTVVAYDKIVTREQRSLHLPTLFGFSLLNGLFETMLFVASFKLGVAIASFFTTGPVYLFLLGTFFAYLGAIHAFFWLKILPPHLNKSAAVKPMRTLWIVALTIMSLLWGWLYFAYQDIGAVVVLHILFDAAMVYSIRYRLT